MSLDAVTKMELFQNNNPSLYFEIGKVDKRMFPLENQFDATKLGPSYNFYSTNCTPGPIIFQYRGVGWGRLGNNDHLLSYEYLNSNNSDNNRDNNRSSKLWQPLKIGSTSPPPKIIPDEPQVSHEQCTYLNIPLLLLNSVSGPLDLRMKKSFGIESLTSNMTHSSPQIGPKHSNYFEYSMDKFSQNHSFRSSCEDAELQGHVLDTDPHNNNNLAVQVTEEHCKPLNLSVHNVGSWRCGSCEITNLNGPVRNEDTSSIEIKTNSGHLQLIGVGVDTPDANTPTQIPYLPSSNNIHHKSSELQIRFATNLANDTGSPARCKMDNSPTKCPSFDYNEALFSTATHDIKCPHDDCNRTFHSKGALTIHAHRFHSPRIQETSPVDNHPKKCQEQQRQQQSRQKQSRSHNRHDKSVGKTLTCTYAGCGRSFREMKHLKVHQMQHTDDKPLACQLCTYKCRQRNSMNWHMKAKHGHDKKVTQDGKTIYLRKEQS